MWTATTFRVITALDANQRKMPGQCKTRMGGLRPVVNIKKRPGEGTTGSYEKMP
jgi:hypothetical protein